MKKLYSSFSVEDDPQEENILLPKIKELTDSGNGDLGRLQFIYDAVSNNKPLCCSDSICLESKLNSPPPQKIVKTFDGSPPKNIAKSSEIIKGEVTLKKIPGGMPKG